MWTMKTGMAIFCGSKVEDRTDSYQPDGPVWSVSDRGTAGPLDRAAQIAEHRGWLIWPRLSRSTPYNNSKPRSKS
jgi:hypothetical protein